MRRIVVGIVICLVFAPVAAAQVNFEGAVKPPHTPTVRPGDLFLSADGTLEVTGMHWRNWGGKTAVGYGEAEYHGCSPSCAQAPAHHAKAEVKLSKIVRCQHRSWYAHVTIYTRRASGAYRLYESDPTNWAPCQQQQQ
ncbi:MAG: hypothetical protein WAK93_19805 [Solirubrobacteraceae bacterium]